MVQTDDSDSKILGTCLDENAILGVCIMGDRVGLHPAEGIGEGKGEGKGAAAKSFNGGDILTIPPFNPPSNEIMKAAQDAVLAKMTPADRQQLSQDQTNYHTSSKAYNKEVSDDAKKNFQHQQEEWSRHHHEPSEQERADAKKSAEMSARVGVLRREPEPTVRMLNYDRAVQQQIERREK
jgi:hypothetical protein